MFRKKYAFFYIYSIVFVIYTFNVRVSNCEAGSSLSITPPNSTSGPAGRGRRQGPGPPKPPDMSGEQPPPEPTGKKHPKGPRPQDPHNKTESHTDLDREGEFEVDIKSMLEESMTVPPMPFITVPYTMVFEGVDYDHFKVIHNDFYEKYYDCFYWFTRCVRDMTNFHYVCAYFHSTSWVNFANLCQLDLENCRHRITLETWKSSQGIYGTPQGNEYDYRYLTFYHGDGYNCKYEFRRNVPDDRVNFYFEDQYRRTMREIEENITVPFH